MKGTVSDKQIFVIIVIAIVAFTTGGVSNDWLFSMAAFAMCREGGFSDDQLFITMTALAIFTNGGDWFFSIIALAMLREWEFADNRLFITTTTLAIFTEVGVSNSRLYIPLT